MTIHMRFSLSCDSCGVSLHSVFEPDYNNMIKRAKEANWVIGPKAVTIGIDGPDFCQNCVEKGQHKPK